MVVMHCTTYPPPCAASCVLTYPLKHNTPAVNISWTARAEKDSMYIATWKNHELYSVYMCTCYNNMELAVFEESHKDHAACTFLNMH